MALFLSKKRKSGSKVAAETVFGFTRLKVSEWIVRNRF